MFIQQFKLSIALLLFFSQVMFPNTISAASVIANMTDNRSQYPGSQIPKYEKLEITFNINGSSASNTFFPFDPNPPSGIPPSTGITVNAIFTDPQGNSFTQPAFYYQEFQDQVKGNKEWFYPTNHFSWKVRFSPNKSGTWRYKITVTDSSGSSQSAETALSVNESTSKGFLKVSPNDARYFEYDDGTYFPALGYNLNGNDLDSVNPVIGNESKLQIMQQNGIELSRVWISQFSIYGEAYGKWDSPNPVHQTQEPRYGIVNPINSQFSTNYPNLVPPSLPAGSEYYMWLEFNDTVSPDGTQQRFTPCRFVTQVPVKQNTDYRIKVRYKTMNLEGPLVAGQPYGFAIKTSNSSLSNTTSLCNEPGAGSVVAATYNSQQVSVDPQNAGWSFLEGIYSSGTSDFLPNLYLTFNNVKSQDNDNVAGHVFIDRVWMEEASCSSNCPNLLSKPWMSMHLYINQRDAHSFDDFLTLAHQYGIYLKAVMLEKNDRIFQTIDFNGQPTANQNVDNFYGNGQTVTKVRWLQQAWWRYMQARWGYSTNIHSWELLNEGGPTINHYSMADEFGKYMHCRVFGQEPVLDPVIGNGCRRDQPNSHLVTTSFYGSEYPWEFWNNGGPANAYQLYRDIDYADQHYYSNVDDTGALASYYDSALFSYKLSTTNNFTASTKKPFIRGETAWNPPADVLFESNADGGEWLHDFIWAGINHGGLIEHFSGGGHFTEQIYNLSATPPYDHRPMFRTFNRFIKDIPLNNGRYQDAFALTSATNLEAWGQKDLTNQRAHLWIRNKLHTWYNVLGGYPGGPSAVTIAPVSGTVTISGFTPYTSYPVEWWNTYTGQISNLTSQTANSSGTLVLIVNNLTSDMAVRIGNYPPSPSLTPERDTTGVFRPSNGIIFLKNTNDTGFADVALNYGIPGDYPVVGDWDGNGTVTIGIYRNGYFYQRNSNTIGFADVVFPFGTPGDQPIAGDWNGDGVDTIGVYRPWTGQFLLRNSNDSGSPEMSFYLGNVGDVGIAGDWNGDSKDTTGVFRPSNGIIFLKNTNDTGFADVALNYGLPGDQPVMGDWDNDGIDTIGVYRNGQFMLRNSNTVGFAEIIFGLGNPGDIPIAGNWDGQP